MSCLYQYLYLTGKILLFLLELLDLLILDVTNASLLSSHICLMVYISMLFFSMLFNFTLTSSIKEKSKRTLTSFPVR